MKTLRCLRNLLSFSTIQTEWHQTENLELIDNIVYYFQNGRQMQSQYDKIKEEKEPKNLTHEESIKIIGKWGKQVDNGKRNNN